MKLYLFGGAEIENNGCTILKKLIKEVIVSLNPKMVLHIPYARKSSNEWEWREGWFNELMEDTGIKVLDARNETELMQFDGQVVFVNGGHEKQELLEAINNNPKLKSSIINCQNYISESAGSNIIGEYVRKSKAGEGSEIIKGLGILKNVIIESHFTARKSKQLLEEEMAKSGMRYGLGIDSHTAIVIEPQDFPSAWTKIGEGNIFIFEK